MSFLKAMKLCQITVMMKSDFFFLKLCQNINLHEISTNFET